MPSLHAYLHHAAERWSGKVAVEGNSDRITYGDLNQLSLRTAGTLTSLGISPGDRVGLYLPKSISALAGLHGAMMAGAAYVPVDPAAPVRRNVTIHQDCDVRAAIVSERYADAYRTEWELSGRVPLLITVPGDGSAGDLEVALNGLGSRGVDPAAVHEADEDDLAYILYTSGSTGRPKGVMLTHGNATAFVEWCLSTFRPAEEDRCSSHAPFHFDLSILDIYMSFGSGATLVLVSEELGKDPVRLAPFISERRITIWYSAPSILSLLAEFGKLEQHHYGLLRLVLFAGEVFPIKHLGALKRQIPRPAYYNLYGPTETNVCTFYRIPDVVPADRTEPYPIGRVCSHLEAKVIDEGGSAVPLGTQGELTIRGPAVTQGYWNLPDASARAFHTDDEGRSWYRTGDLVVEDPDHGFDFLGRRDRMIKKRGFRIELGEIEARLYEHDGIQEVAVVADTRRSEGDLQVVAFLVPRGGEKLSIIALKTFSSERLPSYMVPDRFVHLSRLPHTSTDKVDYQALQALLTRA